MPGIHKIPSEIMEVNVEKIALDMAPPVTNQMLDSVRNMGIFQEPIAVEDEGVFKIIVGRRRVIAAIENGERKISLKVLRNGLNEIDLAKIILIENFQRSPNPISEARAIKILVDEGGLPVTEVASMLGISKPKVFQRLQLLKLPNAIIEGVSEGNIPFSVARAMLPMLPDDTSNGYGEPIEELTAKFDTTGKLTLNDVAEVRERYFGKPVVVQQVYERVINRLSRKHLRELVEMLQAHLEEEENEPQG